MSRVRPSTHPAAGQAAPELLAAALLAWQLVAVLAAGGEAEERARAAALAATGPPGTTLTVRVSQRVPALLPGLEGLAVGARAAVRAP